MKRVTLFALAALLIAAPVMAQDTPAEGGKWRLAIGGGAALPAKDDAFVEKATAGGYMVADIEYEVSPRLSLFGKVDLSKLQAKEGPDYKATSLGGGGVIWFDLAPNNAFVGGIKLGASKTDATEMIPTPTWQPHIGFFVQGNFNGNADIRAGADFTTYQDSERISAVLVYAQIVFDPTAVWK